MSNTYITIVDGEYKKAKAPDVPQPWKPTMPEAASGGGLPDPSSYDDGTVLIKVGNEWKAQSGYGYEEEPAFEPIEWDGDTEGKIPVADLYYFISDETPTIDELIGGTVKYIDGASEETHVLLGDDLDSFSENIYGNSELLIICTLAGASYQEFVFPNAGIYFCDTTRSLTAPSSVTTIDPKFIPQSGNEFVVNFSMNGGGTVTADKTPTEVMQAYSLGKHCVGIFGANHFTFDGGMFQLILFDEGKLSVAIFGELDTENWEFVEASYTLTPASQD